MRFISSKGAVVRFIAILFVLELSVCPAYAASIDVTGSISTEVLEEEVFKSEEQGMDDIKEAVTMHIHAYDKLKFPSSDAAILPPLYIKVRLDHFHGKFGTIWEFTSPVLKRNAMSAVSRIKPAEEQSIPSNSMTMKPYSDSKLIVPENVRGVEGGDLYFGIGTEFETDSLRETENEDWLQAFVEEDRSLPAEFPLYGAGMVLLGLANWRHKRLARKRAEREYSLHS